MTEADKLVIERYASCDRNTPVEEARQCRAHAVRVYHSYLRKEPIHGTPHMRFMSEVDNKCPDLMLRSRYRAEVLGKDWTL